MMISSSSWQHTSEGRAGGASREGWYGTFFDGVSEETGAGSGVGVGVGGSDRPAGAWSSSIFGCFAWRCAPDSNSAICSGVAFFWCFFFHSAYGSP